MRAYVLDSDRGRPRDQSFQHPDSDDSEEAAEADTDGYIQAEQSLTEASDETVGFTSDNELAPASEDPRSMTKKQKEQAAGRVIDVLLSDMCEPWEQTTGFGKRSVSDAYFRMQNTTGVAFKDHAGSMV